MFSTGLFGSLFVLTGASARAEGPDYWRRVGREALLRAKALQPLEGKARNVILFLGDGMGVTTVTAARILEGQSRGGTGEEHVLSFERLPYTCLVKTYNTNAQTADSAGSMTAIMSGVKTKAGVIAVNEHVVRGDHRCVEAAKVPTLLELAERAGLSTGIVTTARVTHATPACCYAHAPERWWEDDTDLSPEARKAGFPDIARQLVEFSVGNGIDVVMGGGRQHFLPKDVEDPERGDVTGRRGDGRDLIAEWRSRPGSVYIWNLSQFDALKPKHTDRLLGLFDPSHMEYEADRSKDAGKEPSLSQMTRKAIELLSRNKKGFFLMVEGARIDHGHHACNAYRALTDAIEFARAVQVAVDGTNREDTLIVVTADHGHGLAFTGYATRGNPILGKVRENNARGEPGALALDGIGRPYTTLVYAMGPGYVGATDQQPVGPKRFPHSPSRFAIEAALRPDLANVDTTARDYLVETALSGHDAPHSGEDVALYADGPLAHLFHGVQEQHYLFYVMAEALRLRSN